MLKELRLFGPGRKTQGQDGPDARHTLESAVLEALRPLKQTEESETAGRYFSLTLIRNFLEGI